MSCSLRVLPWVSGILSILSIKGRYRLSLCSLTVFVDTKGTLEMKQKFSWNQHVAEIYQSTGIIG